MHFPSSGNRRTASRLWGGVLFSLAIAVLARGQALVFPNFTSSSGLTLTLPSATTTTSDGNVLRLVPATGNNAGAAFATTQRTVTSGFSTAFDFRLTNPGGSSDGTAVGADGFVFTIQHVGVSAIGASGEGMGFLNIGAASIGVEFDTFQNANRGDLDSNHIGIDLAGSVNSVVQTGAGAITPAFDNGAKWSGWVDYNGTTLEVRVSTNGIRPTSPNLSYTINSAAMQTTLGGTAAFVGFTAGTGGAYANHDIVAWTFSDQYVPGGVTAGLAVPEPGTSALLAIGLGALGIGGRRRFKRAR